MIVLLVVIICLLCLIVLRIRFFVGFNLLMSFIIMFIFGLVVIVFKFVVKIFGDILIFLVLDILCILIWYIFNLLIKGWWFCGDSKIFVVFILIVFNFNKLILNIIIINFF